jgi:Domain of unknown function (DUF4270)
LKQQFRRHYQVVIFLVLVALASGGCKENTLINSKVSPSANQINMHDTTLSCITHTYYDDTAQTSTDISGIPVYQAVGSMTDPFFGTMTAATFFQVIPLDPNNDSFFYKNTVDSAILVLPYSGYTTGDTSNTTATQTYQVFYITDSMTGIYTPYFSYNTKPVDLAHPLSAPYTVNIHSLHDSFVTVGVLPINYPGLRIPLKKELLQSHLSPAQDALHLSSNPFGDFIAKFNGVCVRVADTRNPAVAMPYFQLDGSSVYSEAGILIYYHVIGAPVPSPDSSIIASYYFSQGQCAHFNSISKSYAHYPVNALFNSKQKNDSIIALQYQPGASIDVVIPGLMNLDFSKIIINKAELQLSLLPGSYNPPNYQLPEKLYPQGIGNTNYPGFGILPGGSYILSDYFPTGSASPLAMLDGYYHLIDHGSRKAIPTFTIDIPREVMTSRKANNDTLHLHINGTQDLYGAFHMVAAGGSYSDTALRPRLFIVYTKLNQ